ncbi:aminotransferase class IV [Portibacter lacus]|uniref:branched-chain-amino-acid transaminase n=1 Tax=Portibacter lacus TaxID=1099794 RepID=A0AA37STP1_9BACT|nr:aminotransferase class IV [Portibacter lacus]GLR19997.1 branched chain amino acid aminotransferase [Portibacter lacus]
MAQSFHFFNGEYLEKDKCFMHVTDLSIQRSFAVFDYFIFIDKTPLYIDDYIQRFRNSVGKMGLKLSHTNREIKEIVSKLINLNGSDKGGIKFVFTGGYAPNGYDATKPNFLVMHLGFPIIPGIHYKEGIKLLLEEYIRDFPTAKTTDYFFSLSIKEKIKQKEAFDILYHKNGAISESSRSNFFIVDADGKVCTTNEGILEGITRAKLIESCAGEIEIVKRPILTEEIPFIKEAFLTSSVKRVIPIRQIGETVIGNGKPGEVTLALRKRLAAFDESYLNVVKNHL